MWLRISSYSHPTLRFKNIKGKKTPPIIIIKLKKRIKQHKTMYKRQHKIYNKESMMQKTGNDNSVLE